MPETNELSEYENKWHIICHYDKEKESVSLEECLALFEFAMKYGWDASWSYKKGDNV